MSKYVDIAIGRLYGRRPWTIHISELLDDDAPEPDPPIIDISKDVTLSWGFVSQHGLFAGTLASSGQLVIRDIRSILYDRLLATKTTLQRDTVFLVTIASNDSRYTWQGHIRQDEVRKPEFERVRQNILSVTLYDGLGDPDNFSYTGFSLFGAPWPRLFHSAIRIDHPIQTALLWDSTNRNPLSPYPLNLTIPQTFTSLPGVHKFSEVKDLYTSLFLLRVFQGMDGFWHVRQAWTMASDVLSGAGGGVAVIDKEPVFQPPEWQSELQVNADVLASVHILRVDLDEPGADIDRILEPPINEVQITRKRTMASESPDNAIDFLKDGSFEEPVDVDGSGSGSGSVPGRSVFAFWDNEGAYQDTRNTDTPEIGLYSCRLEPGDYVRQKTLYVDASTEHFWKLIFDYAILASGGSHSAEFSVSIDPLFPSIDDAYYLQVDGSWLASATIISTSAQAADPLADPTPSWYTQQINSVELPPISGKLVVEFFGGTGSGDSHHVLIDRAGLLVTDNEGTPTQSVSWQSTFRQLNALAEADVGEAFMLNITADVSIWPLQLLFMEPYDPPGILQPTLDQVALWIADDGSVESDLAKVIADKIFSLQGSRRWGLEGTISRIIPPEAVLFYDDTYWVCDYLRVNLFDETTSGHWIELSEMAGSGSGDTPEGSDDALYPDWSHYVEITTDESLVDEANSVLRYNLANAPAEFWSTVKTDGGDIRMSGSLGTVFDEIPVDLIDFDQGGETGWIAFKSYSGPTFLKTDEPVTYRIYYGNAAEDFPDPDEFKIGRDYVYNDVFESYEAVIHLEEDPTGSAPQYLDSTGNGHDGTTSGAAAGDTLPGKIGMGFDPDGLGEYSSHGQLMPDSETAFTWCVWRHPDSGSGAGRGIISQDQHPNGLTIRTASTGASVDIRKDNAVILGPVTTSGFSMSKVVLTYDPINKWKLYIDGVERDTDTSGYPNFAGMSTKDFRVSGRVTAGTTFIGIIDEVYLLLAEMSAEWVSTEYNMDSDNGSFFTTGVHTANT